MHDSVTAWWGASHAETGAKPIPYPSTLYTLHPKTRHVGQLRDDDPLVGEGGLYYPNFRVARAELMFGLTDRNQAVLREDLLAVRMVQAEGWLKEIHVLPDKVTATIGGTQVIGKAYVAIQGSGLRARQEVLSRHVSLNLPSQLPDQVEILLLSDKLLDHAVFTTLENPSPRKLPQVVVERADVFGYETPFQEQEPRAGASSRSLGQSRRRLFLVTETQSHRHLEFLLVTATTPPNIEDECETLSHGSEVKG